MNIWEGAVAVRRAAFDYAEGWPEPFWYAHEGIELAWRVWDAGYHVRYDGEIEVHHPAIQPTRHAEFYRFQARNRVWLARRNLPCRSAARMCWPGPRSAAAGCGPREAVAETCAATGSACATPAGERRPMRWRTVWRMARAGRPPII